MGLFVQIPIRTPQRLPILISHNPTSARVLHCVLTALPCMNWFSQASLAPIRPLMEQGHWANRSSRLFRRLGAMRKICRGLTQQQQHATPQRPQVATRRRISRLWGCIFFWMITTPTPASQHSGSYTNSQHFPLRGYPSPFFMMYSWRPFKQILMTVTVSKVLWVCSRVWPYLIS